MLWDILNYAYGASNEDIFADFGGHRFVIYKLGPFRYKLWCHDVSESHHWFQWMAKRQAKYDALEFALHGIARLLARDDT